MTNPKHGAMHVYSEAEAVRHESLGWSRAEWPPKPKAIEDSKPAAEIDADGKIRLKGKAQR